MHGKPSSRNDRAFSMIPKTRSERVLFLLAFLMPLVFFMNLPLNVDSSNFESMDTFFGADSGRVVENLRDTDSVSHYRDKVHPYFSLFAVSVAKLGRIRGMDGAEFVIYRVFFGTLGVFLFWLLILSETEKPLTAFSAVLLLLSTFTVKVWSTLPETSLFSFFTLMLALNLARMKADVVPVFIISLSGATTNAFLGIVYFFRKFALSRELFESVLRIVFCVAILSMLQKMIYPSSLHFFDISELNEERTYVNPSVASIPFRLFDFFYSGFVIPLPDTMRGNVISQELWSAFLLNATDAYDKRVVFGVALVLILVPLLIAASVYRFIITDRHRNETSQTILLFLAFQFLLHMVYGDTPFLYSYHFLPMIILFVCLQLPRSMVTVAAMIGFSAILQLIQVAQLERFNLMFG